MCPEGFFFGELKIPRGKAPRNLPMQGIVFYYGSLANPAASCGECARRTFSIDCLRSLFTLDEDLLLLSPPSCHFSPNNR
jgi:hypothetical protein